ncbi:MAG TPA: FUSC family protein [Aliidongia sp.]|nr:FUSC family protein [Aliidongia sp.]
MTALLRQIDQTVDIRSLARAVLVLAPLFAAALSTGNPQWMRAALVTASAFIAMEKTGLAPLGVALHGLAIGAGFLTLLATVPFPSFFAVGSATMAAGTILLTVKGERLRTLGNFTFIPALYLACEFTEMRGDSAFVRGCTFLPYLALAILPVLLFSAAEHEYKREPHVRYPAHLGRVRHPDADLGTAARYWEGVVAVALAAGVAALFAEWRHLSYAQWLIWSAASVVTGNAAGARRKLTDRAAGALVGVPIGVICAWLVPHVPSLLHLAEISAVLTLTAFRIYRLGFGARCACVAFALTFAGQTEGAIERVANVALGGSIGLAFVFAAHAVALGLKGRLLVRNQGRSPAPAPAPSAFGSSEKRSSISETPPRPGRAEHDRDDAGVCHGGAAGPAALGADQRPQRSR